MKTKINKVLPTRAELRRIRTAIIDQLYDYRHLGYNTTFLTALFGQCTKRTVVSMWKDVKAKREREAHNDQNQQ
jgi:hypothetical protein